MNKFWIMLGHTYLGKVKSKSFLISTGLTLLFLFAIVNIDKIIGVFESDGDDQKTVAVIDETNELYTPFSEILKTIDEDIALQQAAGTDAQLEEQVKEAEIEGILLLNYDNDGLPVGIYKSMSMTDNSIASALTLALQQTKVAVGTAQLNVQAEELNKLLAPSVLERIALEDNAKSEAELNSARVLVYILLFVIYFSVIMYANMIASEVANEKSSRVMEILISSVSPVKQMFAKILGIGLVAFTQFAVFGIVGYYSLQQKMDDLGAAGEFFNFSDITISTIVYALIFFILGYFLYSTLAALLGSLVSRIEEVQQLIAPMMFLVIAAFMIAMFGLNAPEAPFITVTSYIPFFTPMIMFLRVGMLNVPTWEIALSIGILIATIVILAIFGARVYKGGVLMYGKGSLKDIKKAIQLSKE